MIDHDVLKPALAAYLARQRWFAGSEVPTDIRIVVEELRRPAWPALLWLLVDADGARYQVVLGMSPAGSAPDFLKGHDDQVLGEFETSFGPAVVYDAVIDPELAIFTLGQVAPGEVVEHVRPIAVEQSNSSLVFDERLIMKLFRRIHPGPNPEIEVTTALDRAGFSWVAPPLATATYHEHAPMDAPDVDGGVLAGQHDLALVQPFLNGGVDAWALALTSLRGFFADHDTQSMPVIDADDPPPDPDQVGGDFAADSARLGGTTAAMHVALADALGRRPADPMEWAASVESRLNEDLGHLEHRPDADQAAASRLFDKVRALADPGSTIRVHGDLHLGQMMRTDAGWFVLDFEGEPARPLDERRRFWSPLRDVAGMCRSFHYASMLALDEQGSIGSSLQEAAATWEKRNRAAFLRGYREGVAGHGLLPSDPEAERIVLAAHELERALYELAYEQAYRPAWVAVPLAGIKRILASVS